MKKTGLNALCFCGSKKKYKHCCKQRFVNFNLELLEQYADEVNESTENQLELFKSHYAKIFTSFSLELVEKGLKKLDMLIKKYNDFWQEYCERVNLTFPEKETYFLKNIAKHLGAELTN